MTTTTNTNASENNPVRRGALKSALRAYEQAMHEFETGACSHPGTFEKFIEGTTWSIALKS